MEKDVQAIISNDFSVLSDDDLSIWINTYWTSALYFFKKGRIIINYIVVRGNVEFLEFLTENLGKAFAEYEFEVTDYVKDYLANENIQYNQKNKKEEAYEMRILERADFIGNFDNIEENESYFFITGTGPLILLKNITTHPLRTPHGRNTLNIFLQQVSRSFFIRKPK